MKAKKIFIGIAVILALLITIAGALAAPTAVYTPSSSSVTVNNTQQTPFSIAVTNPEMLNLSYQWLVDGVPAKAAEQNSGNYTSSFTFDATGKSVGNHLVSVVVNGAVPDLSHAWTVTVQDAVPQSKLTVSKVEINGKTNGKISLSETNKIEVEVSNDYTSRIEDITVTVRILDVDGDDLEEEEEISKLSSNDEDTITVEFDLTDEELDEDEYTLEIELEGEATDNTDHSDIETQTVEVDREKDDLIITQVELQDSQVICSAQTSLSVNIKNIGENDQDGAKITVKNSELGLNLQRANIDLDDYSGSDNDYEATFALNLEDVATGVYTLEVSVYSEDNDLMDSEEVELQVQCANDTSNNGTTPSKEETEATEYADKELAAELQQKLDQYKAMQENQAVSKGTFRESNSYVLLLGVLVAMMFFAAALTVAYWVLKKK